MSVMDYQLAVLLAPTAGLVLWVWWASWRDSRPVVDEYRREGVRAAVNHIERVA